MKKHPKRPIKSRKPLTRFQKRVRAIPEGPAQDKKPFWKGPQEDGITFSLLNRFIECRERFRLRVVEGLVDDEGFQRSMEYGSMWHEAEAVLAKNPTLVNFSCPAIIKAMQGYRDKLLERFPDSHKDIQHWYSVCRAAFPVYVQHWYKTHHTRPLLQETAFRVPYTLPSGRTLTLRGKWDAVYLKGKNIWLQENKTKGEIDEEGIMATVDENLQVMFYLIALDAAIEKSSGDIIVTQGPTVGTHSRTGSTSSPGPGAKLAGVLYNVVRRPLADRYAIRQKKSEDAKQFYKRLQDVIREKPDHYFKRWEANITPQDIKHFKKECFDPILENLLDWWQWISIDPHNPFRPYVVRNEVLPAIHWRTPFGIHNSLAGGFRGSYFNLLTKKSQQGLRHITTLFPELEE